MKKLICGKIIFVFLKKHKSPKSRIRPGNYQALDLFEIL